MNLRIIDGALYDVADIPATWLADMINQDYAIVERIDNIMLAVNAHDALVANLINCCCALEKMGVITFAAQLADARAALAEAGVTT